MGRGERTRPSEHRSDGDGPGAGAERRKPRQGRGHQRNLGMDVLT